ncbi:MAG: methyltransferase, partial [Arenimonas sp.]|nr:methyltransferase [Arenimonas sp.]
MRPTLSPLALALAALMLGACTPASQDAPADADAPATTDATPAADATADVAPPKADSDPLDAILAGDWRDPANVARDAYRHPRETLAFFGVGPRPTLVAISPGAGG